MSKPYNYGKKLLNFLITYFYSTNSFKSLAGTLNPASNFKSKYSQTMSLSLTINPLSSRVGTSPLALIFFL